MTSSVVDEALLAAKARRDARREPAAAARVVLVCVEGPLAGQEFEIPQGGLVVGREGHVRVPDEFLSRRHFEVAREEDGVVRVRDLGSRNGTFLNTLPARNTKVHTGDEIRAGVNRFKIEQRAWIAYRADLLTCASNIARWPAADDACAILAPLSQDNTYANVRIRRGSDSRAPFRAAAQASLARRRTIARGAASAFAMRLSVPRVAIVATDGKPFTEGERRLIDELFGVVRMAGESEARYEELEQRMLSLQRENLDLVVKNRMLSEVSSRDALTGLVQPLVRASRRSTAR